VCLDNPTAKQDAQGPPRAAWALACGTVVGDETRLLGGCRAHLSAAIDLCERGAESAPEGSGGERQRSRAPRRRVVRGAHTRTRQRLRHTPFPSLPLVCAAGPSALCIDARGQAAQGGRRRVEARGTVRCVSAAAIEQGRATVRHSNVYAVCMEKHTLLLSKNRTQFFSTGVGLDRFFTMVVLGGDSGGGGDGGGWRWWRRWLWPNAQMACALCGGAGLLRGAACGGGVPMVGGVCAGSWCNAVVAGVAVACCWRWGW
jgi:hypothetical protein